MIHLNFIWARQCDCDNVLNYLIEILFHLFWLRLHLFVFSEPMFDSQPLPFTEPVGDADYEFYKTVLKPSWSLTVVTDFQQVLYIFF